jgi:hypothetical protein
MNANIKDIVSRDRLADTIRNMRLYISLAIGSFILFPAAALPNGDSHHLLEEIFAQSQNIKKMIVRYQYGINPPELLYIRSQTNAFYMRITTADQFEADFQIEETHCGRWNEDYWLYEYGTPPVPGVPAPPPMLMMHSDTEKERGSKAFWTVTHHQSKLNLIRSLGISQVGPGAIKLEGSRFQVMPPDGPFVLTGHFSEFDDEYRPLVAILEYKDNEGVTIWKTVCARGSH